MQDTNCYVKKLSKKVAQEAVTQRKLISGSSSISDEDDSPNKKSYQENLSINLITEQISAKKKRKAPLPPSNSDSDSLTLTPTRPAPLTPQKPSLSKKETLDVPVDGRTMGSNGPPKPPRLLDSKTKEGSVEDDVFDEGASLLYPWKELSEVESGRQRIFSPKNLLAKKKQAPQLVVTEMIDRRVSRDPLGDIVILDDSTKSKLIELQEAANYETSVIKQTMKALHACQNNLNQDTAKGIVECQMLLLVASKRRTQLVLEMQKIKSCNQKHNFTNCGRLEISKFKLPLKTTSDIERPENLETHYFIIMCKYENILKFTSLMSTEEQSISGLLEFSDILEFNNICEDSSLDLEVYSTLISICPEPKTYSPHKKFTIPKSFLSKKKLKNENLRCFGLASNINKIGQIRTFVLVANATIQVQSGVACQSSFSRTVPANCPLADHLFFDINFKENIDLRLEGFLTMFEMIQDFGAWHRRWFQMSRGQLKYWNYPTDCKDNKQEIGIFELEKCTSLEITLVPRDVCARPNTFQIEFSNCSGSIDKIWLAADSVEEKCEWCRLLNQQLSIFRKL